MTAQKRHASMGRLARLVLFAIVFALVLFSRQPDALLHAELWGDEGWSFYPDAYRHGWQSLSIPAGGYLTSFQRLIAVLSTPFPLTAVPTLFAIAAFAVQLLPALFLVSGRMDRAIPSAPCRIALALLYLLTPHVIELYVNLTNTQWTLALLALLVVIGSPPRGGAGWAFDGVVLILSGLSGPFGFMLAPVALWRWRELPCRSTRFRLGSIVATAAIQLLVILFAPHDPRSHAPLGAGPRMLAQVLASQLLLASEIGWRSAGPIQALTLWRDNLLPILLVSGAAIVAAASLLRGPAALRQAALFAGLLLGACLLSPQVALDRPAWEYLTHLPVGERYFALPALVWFAMLVSLVATGPLGWRILGTACLLPVLFYAIPHEWAVPEQPRTDFQAKARLFESAPPGTEMIFPIIPPGLTPMHLTKAPR